ncbi:hypothetical protein D9758_011983 [Tetrapyrgos nigripes]|uniref:Zinc finger Mcm10/DnaG-type domain-containing protein n=1 Tax=Tetrapyrgos nigripes TaxID=182062 RepID=A0A8H5CQI7_9AGAR|nr:hypothetical protein D9758_011983 [Tetrapyrgos nigripes]
MCGSNPRGTTNARHIEGGRSHCFVEPDNFQALSERLRQTAPNPTTNILAITPESAESITTIGHAKDLRMCCVIRRDRKPCGARCDPHVNSACDYHLEMVVKHARSGRSEFSAGTFGSPTSAAVKRKHPSKHEGCDPKRQWD